jgi:Mn2+/Fe2+ NRAMP family transporter
MDVVLGILVFTALAASPADSAGFAFAIGSFVGWPLVTAALLSLLSGVVIAVGSKIGLTRYRWVLVKLVLTLVLLILTVTLLVPSVAEVVRAASESHGPVTIERSLIFPPIVSSLMLIFAIGISVIRPWGRRRRREDPR